MVLYGGGYDKRAGVLQLRLRVIQNDIEGKDKKVDRLRETNILDCICASIAVYVAHLLDIYGQLREYIRI